MRPPNVRACVIVLGALLTLTAQPRLAQAGFVASESALVTPTSSGMYRYSYTITVDPTSTTFASEFDLTFAGTINSLSMITPSNFTFQYSPIDPTNGIMTSSLSFYATDDGSGTNDIGIAPGSSGTFSFLSTYAPALGTYDATGFDDSNNFGSISGTTLTPSIVPEPASLVLLGLGGAGVLGLHLRSRRGLRV